MLAFQSDISALLCLHAPVAHRVCSPVNPFLFQWVLLCLLRDPSFYNVKGSRSKLVVEVAESLCAMELFITVVATGDSIVYASALNTK